MSDSTRGGLIVAIIIFAVAVYYFTWIYEPGGTEPKGDSKGDQVEVQPTSYLETKPEIPDRTPMSKGKAAPDFAYMSIDGQKIRLSDFEGKKPVVLDFWATWCGPCRMELPVLEEFYKNHGDEVEVIAITDDDRQNVNKVFQTVKDLGLTFPVIHDPSKAIAGIYPPERGIPFLVFIDRDGIVIDTATGFNPSLDLSAEILNKFGM